MKSKIFAIVIAILIVLPISYVAFNELKYRATHTAAENADTTSIPNHDTLIK